MLTKLWNHFVSFVSATAVDISLAAQIADLERLNKQAETTVDYFYLRIEQKNETIRQLEQQIESYSLNHQNLLDLVQHQQQVRRQVEQELENVNLSYIDTCEKLRTVEEENSLLASDRAYFKHELELACERTRRYSQLCFRNLDELERERLVSLDYFGRMVLLELERDSLRNKVQELEEALAVTSDRRDWYRELYQEIASRFATSAWY